MSEHLDLDDVTFRELVAECERVFGADPDDPTGDRTVLNAVVLRFESERRADLLGVMLEGHAGALPREGPQAAQVRDQLLEIHDVYTEIVSERLAARDRRRMVERAYFNLRAGGHYPKSFRESAARDPAFAQLIRAARDNVSYEKLPAELAMTPAAVEERLLALRDRYLAWDRTRQNAHKNPDGSPK